MLSPSKPSSQSPTTTIPRLSRILSPNWIERDSTLLPRRATASVITAFTNTTTEMPTKRSKVDACTPGRDSAKITASSPSRTTFSSVWNDRTRPWAARQADISAAVSIGSGSGSAANCQA